MPLKTSLELQIEGYKDFLFCCQSMFCREKFISFNLRVFYSTMSTDTELLIVMKENLKWSYIIFPQERKFIWRMAARILQNSFCQGNFAPADKFKTRLQITDWIEKICLWRWCYTNTLIPIIFRENFILFCTTFLHIYSYYISVCSVKNLHLFLFTFCNEYFRYFHPKFLFTIDL